MLACHSVLGFTFPRLSLSWTHTALPGWLLSLLKSASPFARSLRHLPCPVPFRALPPPDTSSDMGRVFSQSTPLSHLSHSPVQGRGPLQEDSGSCLCFRGQSPSATGCQHSCRTFSGRSATPPPRPPAPGLSHREPNSSSLSTVLAQESPTTAPGSHLEHSRSQCSELPAASVVLAFQNCADATGIYSVEPYASRIKIDGGVESHRQLP